MCICLFVLSVCTCVDECTDKVEPVEGNNMSVATSDGNVSLHILHCHAHHCSFCFLAELAKLPS